MTGRSGGVAAVAVVAAAVAVAGCTGGSPGGTPPGPQPVTVSGDVRLVSFDSCDAALNGLRQAVLPLVGPFGLGGAGYGGVAADASGGAAEAAPKAPSAAGGQREAAAAPEHSSTNVHEAGVDEPDLVKTDGKRVVTVVDGTLRVVDAASRTLTGTLTPPRPVGIDGLLLAGDHALVISRGGIVTDLPSAVPAVPNEPPGKPVPIDGPAFGSELLLVDLSGAPKILATFAVDGQFVDARMVGRTVRVVTHSQPRLNFVYPTNGRDADETLKQNRRVVETAPIEDWLPRFRLEQGGSVQSGQVDCAAVARPASSSATSMLTVLTFDLGANALGTGDPVTIAADGDTVYGTAQSLYVASDTSRLGWLRTAIEDRAAPQTPPQQRTELYKFDITGPGRPRHVASGAVPGSLLNQYSMSEFDGHLRVATTLGFPGVAAGAPEGSGPPAATSESTVYVLAQRGAELAIAGKVGGLGRNERIYAVRFVGPLGYVVTFRQTDPLYTLDLRNPAAPKVSGELKISGYSAYLHPAGDGRVIGVGQEASDQGRVQGTQVSLFDVSDPAAPRRLAQYHVPGGSSEAEYDPHAFLYWPATGTLVLPIVSYKVEVPGGGVGGGAEGGAVVLHVGDAALAEVGRVGQPEPSTPYSIRRALIVGDTLWTVSEFGAAAHGVAALDSRGWVPFNR